MLDLTTDKGKIISAAFALAAERPWRDVSMRDIADKAGISLAELRRSVGSKTQIIAGYMRAVDEAVLLKPPQADPGESPRDVLFEVVMARLDVMAEHKAALRSINEDVQFDSGLAGSYLNSQRWMLLASGLDGDGPRGVLRSIGLASLFGSVFKIWLEDEDPGQAKTMAALDRRLRRGESAMSGLEQACDTVDRFRKAIRGGFQRAAQGRRRGRDEDLDDDIVPDVGPADPAPGASGPTN